MLRIKQLLYEEGFTIAGAKKKIESRRGQAGRRRQGSEARSLLDDAEADVDADEDEAARQGSKTPVTTVKVNRNNERVLREVRAQLAEILTLLKSGDKIS